MVSLCVRCREGYVEKEADITVQYGEHVCPLVATPLLLVETGCVRASLETEPSFDSKDPLFLSD